MDRIAHLPLLSHDSRPFSSAFATHFSEAFNELLSTALFVQTITGSGAASRGLHYQRLSRKQS
jgi:hypothetical protein